MNRFYFSYRFQQSITRATARLRVPWLPEAQIAGFDVKPAALMGRSSSPAGRLA